MANTSVTYLINLRDKASAKLKGIGKTTKKTDKAFNALGRSIAAFASAAAIGSVLKNAIGKMIEFEATASNLSAITGATGEQLDFLKRKAIEMGKATTKSSIETLEAFKLIASAKPELLENTEALAATTKEAIALSEASGLTLPDAAKALTSALNQFGLSADQSSRVINVLAAGSKFAAAEIPDLAKSLEEFGGVADSLNISLEESSAAVETLSTKGLKGSRAGIQLKNVFLRLGKSTNKDINPAVVGLSKALENLAPIQDDVNALTKLFGTENVIAGQTLIKQRQRVDDLTESLTGTNIAYEQQAINTDNLKSDIDRLGSAWEGLVLNINEGEGRITDTFRVITQAVTRLLGKIEEFNMSFESIGRARAEQSVESIKRLVFKQEQALRLPKLAKSISDQLRTIDFLKSVEPEIKTRFGKVTNTKELKDYNSQLFEAEETLRLLLKFQEELRKPKETKKGIEDTTGTTIDKGAQEVIRTITGAPPKTFNINIEKLVEDFSINTQNLQESAGEVKRQIILALSEALADVQPITD